MTQWEIMFETAHSWTRVSKSTYSHFFWRWKRLSAFASVKIWEISTQTRPHICQKLHTDT